MLSLKVIGCAPGMPQPRLASSSYLVKQRDRLLLLDTGEGLSSALLRCAVDPLLIGSVFISHFHPDHCMGLPLFLQMNYLMGRKERLDVFMPSEAVQGVRRLLNLTYLFPHKLGFELELHKISKDLIFEMTGLVVKPLANRHLQGHAGFLKKAKLPNRMECYSFAIESEGKKIVYSADLAGIDDLVPILDNTDLLVIDGMHIDLSLLPEIALEHGVQRVLLTHVAEDFNFDAAKTACAERGFGALLQAAEGLEIVLQ